MMEDYQTNVERLKVLMTSAATDLNIDNESEKEYTFLRQNLMPQDRFRRLAPKFLITCGTLKEFKREMQSISSSYAGRRTHIKDAFSPLVDSFWGAETFSDAIEDIVQQVDFGNTTLLSSDILERGREMSEVYLYLYCIENSIRVFITEVMKTKPVRVPPKVQETIDKMKAAEGDSKYLPVRGDNDLYYCDFIQLGKIMTGGSNWDIFKFYFPEQSEHWLNVMISELYKIRCLVAHNSYVGDHERRSLKVYYKNITLQLKL